MLQQRKRLTGRFELDNVCRYLLCAAERDASCTQSLCKTERDALCKHHPRSIERYALHRHAVCITECWFRFEHIYFDS
jgi:hypothetical protein